MSSKPQTTTELTKDQLAEFGRLEKTIEKGLETYVDVGNALIKIRDEGYYKNEFETFDDYCLARWGFGRRRANQIIQASEIGDSRLNSRQASALVEVPADQRQEVLDKAQEATDGNLTAKAIADAHQEVAAEVASEGGEEAEEPEKEEKPAEPDKPTDRFGNELPSYVAKHFESKVMNRFSEIMGLIQTAKKRMEALGRTDHGVQLNINAIRAELNNAYRDVKAAKPYCICVCGARTARGCQVCGKQGFIGETKYKTATPEQKANMGSAGE